MEHVSYDPYALPPDGIEEARLPRLAAIRKIGPGIILA